MTWITSRYHPRQAYCARVQIHQIGLLLYQIKRLFSFSVVASLSSSTILVELSSTSTVDITFCIIINLFRPFQFRNSISFRTDFLRFFFYSYAHTSRSHSYLYLCLHGILSLLTILLNIHWYYLLQFFFLFSLILSKLSREFSISVHSSE